MKWKTLQSSEPRQRSCGIPVFCRVACCGLAFFLVAGLSPDSAFAQVTVSGRVTDASVGAPLPGVNVVVQGVTIGTTTDADGRYSLAVPEGRNTLVYSYVGFLRQVVDIAGRTEINVQLQPDVQLLEDIVVVGYGTQRVRDATGAVGSVTERDFNQGIISSAEQLLQGRMAGVQITTASGEPGAGSSIRIRGTSSVRGGNQPLIVVDGVPLTGENVTPGSGGHGAGAQSPRNPLSFLNPDDIENISVLKDASAAAIYGARGSNGVILITTKRGSESGPTLTVNSSTSVSSLPKQLDLLSASEYVSSGQAAGADPTVINFGGATNWQDEIFRTSVSQNHNISYGSASSTGSYRLSLGYADQQGIVENAALERLTARVNADQRLLNDRVNLSLSLAGSRINDSYAPVGNTAGFEGDLIGAALQANPTRPVRIANGDFLQSADFRNPAAMLAYFDDTAETGRLLTNVAGTFNATDWLTYRLNMGYEQSDAVRRTGIDRRLRFSGIFDNRGRATIENRYISSWLVEHTLNSRHTLGNAGSIDALAGFSYQRFRNQGDFLQAQQFVSDDIRYVNNVGGVNNSDFRAFQASSYKSTDELQSFFGRVNYNLKDRYLVTANFRVDGSTKFGANNKYGYFPSVALAWRVSNEDFFAGMRGTISELKLRAGYGITGNQEFPSGVSLALFRTNLDGSLTQINNPNPDIKWEETAQLGVGVDFDLYQGRVGGSLDYFYKDTRNLIFRKDYAQPAAVDFQWVNLDGNVVNSGVELALYALPVTRRALTWRVDYNMSLVNNEVKSLGTFVNTGQIHGQGLSGAYAQRIAEGQPLYAFYMRRFVGFDANGLGIYADDEQLSFVGSPIPDMTLGLTNSFTLGRFDLSAFLEGAFGFQVYNNTANAIFLKGNLRNGRNVTKDAAGSPESPNNFGEASTRFLEDGDYVRLANVNLGYNMDVSRLPQAIRGLRIGLTGQNLLLFTKYTGFDPEVNTDKSIGGVPSLGIDYTAFPRARSYTVSLRMDL